MVFSMHGFNFFWSLFGDLAYTGLFASSITTLQYNEKGYGKYVSIVRAGLEEPCCLVFGYIQFIIYIQL